MELTEKIGKINYTQKEKSPHLLLLMAELSMMSAIGDIKKRSKFTKKFDGLLEEIGDIEEQNHKIVNYLDYCYCNSDAMKENDLAHDKYLLSNLVNIFLAIDNKEIEKAIIELGRKSEKILREK